MDEDPRAVLGVPAGITSAALKRAFRARARATHPDHGGDRVDFEAAVSAYRTLLPEAHDDLPPAAPRWLPYLPHEQPAATFSVYDSRRRRIIPAPASRRDDFAEVLARAMAVHAA